LLYDLIANGKLKASLTKTFIAFKTTIWIITIIPTVFWFIVSKERVPQSEKPPHPVKGILSVFRNRPLLIYTLTGLIGGIDIGSGEDLYYNDVLKFNLLPTVAGIPGMPVSYASYALAPKFRERFSTKMLWYFSSGSIFISEALFFLTGLIGGEKNGFYQKKLPMSIAFGAGNMLEMVFYATKGIVGKEIDYEVLDYCEWKNGFRVEATIKLINGYFTKAKDAILRIVNANLLQDWAKYEIGETAVQTQQTKWRLFLIAFGPHLIFDFLALLPMLFYNIDKDTRERMYIDLERARAKRALMEKLETDEKNA
ncbi:MAG: MFS transporter, partial [Clostridia bacterium]|nr:MFS transporter [Clostridia bacterium]